jgi:abortive infection bacteriophage resistance protein
MYEKIKPILSIKDQINHLAFRGVKFDILSKEEAMVYLSQNNNYFKLTSYRKSFSKHPEGEKKDQYIDLDFELLKDLAIIDMRLRYTLLHMALDVEHFSKVRLLNVIENSKENGYEIVKDFIDSLGEVQQSVLKSELAKVKGNPYCGDILAKYENDFPVWAFIEIITFGRFISFYKFCADRFNDKNLLDDYYLLLATKGLRNAVAHNNCVINDLSPSTKIHKTNFAINRELSAAGISKDIRDRKMSNVRIQQIITLLYTHKKIVLSEGVHRHQQKEPQSVTNRMFHHIDYYSTNETISTTFHFFQQVIDKWFLYDYN